MEIIDMHDPARVSRTPDGVKVLLSGRFTHDEFTVTRVELRLYNEKIDARLGTYCLITSYVRTDSDSVEMVYDEGYRGKNPLLRTAEFLMTTLGVSGLVLRSAIALRSRQ